MNKYLSGKEQQHNTDKMNIEKNNEQIDFKILDGLRGIAALYVVFNHARGNLFIGGVKYAKIKSLSLWDWKEKIYFSILQLTSLGREFVILFFILSGFSIAFSLNKMPRIKEFYFKRILRIYPPYIVALFWAFAVFKFLQNFAPSALPENTFSVFSSFNTTLKNIFYINSGYLIPQFWSLGFEVIFYLLVPFFIIKKNVYLILSFILGVISFFICWNNVTGVSIVAQYILDYNIFFACGVFCFHYYDSVSTKFIFKNKYLFFVVSFILFLMMVAFKFWIKYEMNKVSLLIATLFSFILLFNFLHHNIKNKILLFLGNISYTIYITHFASLILLLGIFLKLGIINSVEIQNKFLWLTGIPFSIGVSYLFYLLVEKPTKNLLIKIRKREV